MNEKIEIKCPRCKYEWKQSLEELEKLSSTVYKEVSFGIDDGIQKYRARCPHDGTYVIVEVAEEDE